MHQQLPELLIISMDLQFCHKQHLVLLRQQ